MLELFQTDSPIFEFITAALLGAFLGIRREIDVQKSPRNHSFMGFRTMTILSVAGVVSMFFPTIPFLPLGFFLGICIIVSIAYANGAFVEKHIGITTELSALLTFWIGALVGNGEATLAIVLTIFLAGMNAFKTQLHNFAGTLNSKEWTGAFQLLIVSGAILPFLPRIPIDPWGAIVPFNIWFLVILISGIGFLGYFLIKYFGPRGGVPLTAFLGAIVSSTAVTSSLSAQSKKTKLSGIFTTGILIALATMQIRVLLEIIFLGSKEFFTNFLFVPITMATTTFAMAFYFFKKTEKKHFGFINFKPEVEIDQPFEILPAIKFGLIFVAVLLTMALGKEHFGSAGVYMAAVFSGLIDVDAIVLSSLEAVRLGEVSAQVAQNSIAISLFVNTIIKIAYVWILGSRKLAGKIAVGVIVPTFVGLLFYFLTV
jgi:uncharacterized membrane protein (DUF4010 family)